MSWLRIDDGFAEHAKIGALSDRSFRLHVTALCYCARNLTDGVLDERSLRIVCAIVAKGNLRRNVAELVDAGLWHPFGDGFEINDFLDYNPTAERVKEDREKARKRVQKHRERNAPGNGVTDGVSNGTPSRPVPKTDAFALTAVQDEEKHRIGELVETSLVAARSC